jgi:KaiC/GvpD/RAD55 family RecA-like ATPase
MPVLRGDSLLGMPTGLRVERYSDSYTTHGGIKPQAPFAGAMGIPVEVPGLNTIIPEIGEGRLIIVESGADPAKSFFVRRLTLSAIQAHMVVMFVTSRDRDEVRDQLSREGGRPAWEEGTAEIVEEDSIQDLEIFGRAGGLLAVDSFSFLTLGLSGPELAHVLRAVRNMCHEKRTTVILATDRGMFEPRAEAVTTHLADGVIQFHAKEGPEGLIRYLRIPKWTDGRFIDRNIYYDFDGRRIAVDLRSRVL